MARVKIHTATRFGVPSAFRGFVSLIMRRDKFSAGRAITRAIPRAKIMSNGFDYGLPLSRTKLAIVFYMPRSRTGDLDDGAQLVLGLEGSPSQNPAAAAIDDVTRKVRRVFSIPRPAGNGWNP